MTITEENRPLCKCHGETMYWQKDSRTKSGGYWKCKIKLREISKRYRIKHKEKIKEYRINNKEKIREIEKKYYMNNKEKKRKLRKEYRINNKEKIKESRINNKEKIKEYLINNKEKIREKKKKYYIQQRELENLKYALNSKSSHRMSRTIKGLAELAINGTNEYEKKAAIEALYRKGWFDESRT